MRKKIPKIIIMFLLASIFILSNFSNVKAVDSSKIDTYSAGDTFKLVKNAYKYIIEDKFMHKEDKIDPKYPDFYFKKGDIVEYTGVHETNVDMLFNVKDFMEVKSGNKKGLIRIENIEPYKTSRPATIQEFISTYGVDKIKSETALNEKISDYKKIFKDSMGYELNMRNFSVSNSLTGKQRIAEYENAYKDLVNSMAATKDDCAFKAVGYKYGWEYQALINKENNYDKIDDAAERFDKAYKDYKKSGSSDSVKTSAITTMQEAFTQMSQKERDTKIEGDKTRADILNDCLQEELDRNVEEEKKQQEYEKKLDDIIYKPISVETSQSGSGLDDVINDADSFLKNGSNDKVDQGELQSFSGILYNILLQVGIAVAVIIGLIIGIKFMLGSAEEKAYIKQILLPYIVGCVVIFGGFGIWKLVVIVLQGI